jgi:hypothetical protein
MGKLYGEQLEGWVVTSYSRNVLADSDQIGPVGAGNLSYPILFVGNEADPVTPVSLCVR